MRRHSTVVVSVVYPGCEPYINQYVQSLLEQEDKQFDLLIANDGASLEIGRLFPQNTIWLELDKQIQPSQIRQLLVDTAREDGYQFLIFSDIDDYYSSNRILETKSTLGNYDFVFNEMVLVNREGIFIQDRYLSSLNIAREVCEYSSLQDRNFIGLDNSAINLSRVKNFTIPKDIVAVDWWIYSILLIQGARGKFMPNVFTYYRQYSENTIGLSSILTFERFSHILQVKIKHYKALVGYLKESQESKIRVLLAERLEQFENLLTYKDDNNFCEWYINEVNKRRELFAGWWSEVVPVSLIKGNI